MISDADIVALIVAAGAAGAGLLQGLTGFAFSVVALSIWAWALTPQQAAPLAVFGALLGQLTSFTSVRGGFDMPRILPMIVAGWLGVPIGVLMLHNADPERFKLVIGVLLSGFCLFTLIVRDPPTIKGGGKGLDAGVGLIGGVLGGLGGMSGFIPALWTQLRGWKRDVRRATMQAYNIAMHVVTIAVYWRTGELKQVDWKLFLIVAPAMLIPSYLGARVYRRASDNAFKQLVLVALLVSGGALVFHASRAIWG